METYCVSCQRNTADENSNVRKTGQYTLREKFSRGFIFASHFFFTFRVDLISRIGYRWIFREDLFSQILVLSMFYIFSFFRGLFFSS